MTTPLQAVPMIQVHEVHNGYDAPDLVGEQEREAHLIQGMSEGVVVDYDTVECLGERYRIGDKIGLMPLMRFAHSAKQGVDSGDLEGLSAMHDMLRDCIHPADWDRFQEDMTTKHASDAEIMPVVGQTIQLLAARPTQRPSDSSSGPPTTSQPSTPTSSTTASPAQRPGMEGLVPVSDLGRARAS
jgi:hypothetical protein